MSKKVLIMSASTGGGHNRAAKAMKEEIEKRCINGEYITCEIVDSLKLINTTMDKIISSGYEKSAKYTPKAWGGVYKISDANIMSKHEFKGNLFNSLLSSRLKKLLKESKPDLIIGTHPFPMIALSTLKKKYPYRNAFNSFFVPPLILRPTVSRLCRSVNVLFKSTGRCCPCRQPLLLFPHTPLFPCSGPHAPRFQGTVSNTPAPAVPQILPCS